MYNRTDFSYLFENLNLHHGMLTLEESWHELKHHLLMARELYVPKFKVPRKVQPKWFDSKIRFKLNCARTKRRRFRSNPTVINQLKVLAVESEVNSMIVSAKESNMAKICKTIHPLS